MTIDGKTNEFRITGGETIKLGRVKLTVREMQISEDENKTDFDSFDNVHEMIEEVKEDVSIQYINREIEQF